MVAVGLLISNAISFSFLNFFLSSNFVRRDMDTVSHRYFSDIKKIWRVREFFVEKGLFVPQGVTC